MKVIAVGLLALAAAAGLMSLTATAQDLQSQPVDVSYSPGETRMLTDDEFAQLKQGLHFTPDSVPMSVGSTARTALVDGVGKTLAIIQVQWLGGPSSTDPSAYFHITFQNLSGCLFSPSASFGFPSSPTGGAAISLVTWNGWSAIHSASAGKLSRLMAQQRLPAFPHWYFSLPTLTARYRNAGQTAHSNSQG